ncbi:UPF0665 family protein [Paramyrothecium foliicola]|nr:UPF0665 family protein [Paramyrothecium foliicola]
MHYIKLLRFPKLSASGNKLQVELLITITTDLGDSYLCPVGPVDLTVSLYETFSQGDAPQRLADLGKLSWRPGMRILKPTLVIPRTVQKAIATKSKVHLCVKPEETRSAETVRHILASSTPDATGLPAEGLIVPAWIALNPSPADTDVVIRKFCLDSDPEQTQWIEFDEEIGDSIARHIWDGGVLCLSAIADGYVSSNSVADKHPLMRAMDEALDSKKSLNVLELGCGVGFLGIGLGALFPLGSRHGSGNSTILLTDLEDAENRARSNISRLERTRKKFSGKPSEVLYENLDWMDAMDGKFGPLVQSRPWDLIVISECTYNADTLSALVGTLSALHKLNVAHASGKQSIPTKAFMATKPRHSSERVVFDMLSKEGWKTLATQVIPLPVIGDEAQSVEMYVLEKI